MHQITATLRLQIRRMLSDLLTAIDEPEQTVELRRQVLATFAFGMILATGIQSELEPPQVHELAIGALVDSFGYNQEQAVALTESFIDAISSDGKPTANAIIHRGVEGHGQWVAGDVEGLRVNVGSVFAVLSE